MFSALWQKDLRQLLYSPLLWVFLCLFQWLATWLYFTQIDQFMATQAQLIGQNAIMTVNDRLITPFFQSMGLLGSSFLPFICMSSISRERQQQTLPLLSSAPISLPVLVLAKWLPLLVVALGMSLQISLMVALLGMGTPISSTVLPSATLSLFLFYAMVCSLGLFLSSLTRSPILAGLSTFALVWLNSLPGMTVSEEDNLLSLLSAYAHFSALLGAGINSSDLVFLLVLTVLFLAWSIAQLSHERCA